MLIPLAGEASLNPNEMAEAIFSSIGNAARPPTDLNDKRGGIRIP
jgi:hypothetical protein